MTVNLRNETARHDFVAEQLRRLKAPQPDIEGVRRSLQEAVESVTSLRLADSERAALRGYLGHVIRQHGRSEIDDETVLRRFGKLLMAAAANSPDMLNLISVEA